MVDRVRFHCGGYFWIGIKLVVGLNKWPLQPIADSLVNAAVIERESVWGEIDADRLEQWNSGVMVDDHLSHFEEWDFNSGFRCSAAAAVPVIKIVG
jgi:hypothetical protein